MRCDQGHPSPCRPRISAGSAPSKDGPSDSLLTRLELLTDRQAGRQAGTLSFTAEEFKKARQDEQEQAEVIRIRAVLPALLAVLTVLAASLNSDPAAAAPWPGPGYVLKFYDGFAGTHLNTRLWTPGWFGMGITGPVNPYRARRVQVR